MSIKRNIIKDLEKWKNNPHRKPLVLQGARQVGKSFILQLFGKDFFENYVYLNFDFEKEHKVEFERTKDPQRLISYISAVKGQKILPQKTLLIFDEIQECNEALNSMKYFYELAPEYAVVCAGSLLGVAMNRKGASFPVGKVDFLSLFPVSFSEFLAEYNPKIADFLQNFIYSFSKNDFQQIPEIIHSQLIEIYKIYLCMGGMPESINRFLENRNWQEVDKINNQILISYTLDFAKHIDSKDILRVHKLWENIQDNLAKEDRKFRYALIEKNARARDYENAIEWLSLTGLVHKVFGVQTPRLPVSSYKNSSTFKLYLSDTGLLRTKFKLDSLTVLKGDRLFTEFKGILTENYVLQALVRLFGKEQFYWTSGNTAEVDFLLQKSGEIIPIEVKSSLSTKARSLSLYRKNYNPKISIKFSLKNLEKQDDLLNLPLYLSDFLNVFLD
ncbi:MAG: ATP-binding protein [Flavobacteriaceae bacterium]|jgi:predicted AAA+ superfamily ATPase|nr:ATP-binding protein [Flavobacteriaceae bacterium]